MANDKKNINLKAGIEVDKSSLNELKKELLELKSITQSEALNLNKSMKPENVNKELANLKGTVNKIEEALKKAFNPKIGTTNIKTFGEELKRLDIDKIYKQLSAFGPIGQSAFRKVASEALTTNVQLKQTHKILDEIAVTMKNTIKWGFSASVMDTFTSKISEAWEFAKKLDTSLNDIRIVTGKSTEEMQAFAKEANNVAKALGASTTDITQASLIYYQQGLSDQESQARAEITTKVANVTGESATEASEQLTAIWNGYKVSAEEAEIYIDKVAKVAATTAADLGEMATGMSKVASAANSAGVNIDQLNGMLSTVISVTREAPETIGSSFKTIFARLGDLELDGEDEYGVSLGKVSTQMEALGIQILDQKGQMRDMGDIIEDTAAKWQTWSQAQRQAAAIAMAGKMQYSRLIALFDNWNMYEKAVSDSQGAIGTLQEQQDIYMESTAAHMEKMKASFEGVSESLFDMDSVNAFADILSVVLDRVADLFDGLGGGLNVLETFGSLGLMVFRKQIAGGIETTIQNFKAAKENAQQFEAQLKNIEDLRNSSAYKEDPVIKDLVDKTEQAKKYYDILDTGRQQELNNAIKASVDANNELEIWKNKKKFAEEFGKAVTQNSKFSFDVDDFDEYQEGVKRVQKQAKELEEEYKKLEESSKKAMKVFESGGSIDDAEEAFEEVAKAAEKYRQKLSEIKELNDITFVSSRGKEAFEAANKLGEMTNELNNIHTPEDFESFNENFSKQVEDSTKSMKVLNYEIQDLGETSKEIFENRDIKTNSLKEEADNANKKVKETLNNAKEISKIESFTTLVSSLGTIQSTMSSINSLTEIFNNDSISNAEKWNKAITTATFQIPSLIAQGKNLIPVLKSIGMVGSAAFGALSVGLIALNLYSTYKEHQLQQIKDRADEAKESLSILEQEQDSLEKNATSFKNLYETYKDTGEGKEELEKITQELCNELGIEINTLDELSNKYDVLNEKIKQNRIEKANQKAEGAQYSQESAELALYSVAGLGNKTLTAKDETWVPGQQTRYENIQMTGYKNFNSGLSLSDEKALSEYLINAFENRGYKVDKEGGFQGVYGLDSDNIEQFYRDLAEIQKDLVKEQAKAENKDLKDAISQGELYDSLTKMIQESAPYLEQIDEGKRKEREGKLEKAGIESRIENISSIKEYEQLTAAMAQKLKDELKLEAGESLTNIVSNYLSGQGLSQYQQGSDLKQQIIEKVGGDKNQLFYETLDKFSEEELSILVNLDIDENTTEKNLENALKYAQLKADEQPIKTSLTQAQSVYSKVSQGKDLSSKEEKEAAADLEKKYDDLAEASKRWGQNSSQYAEILHSHLEELENDLTTIKQDEENIMLDDLAQINITADESAFQDKIEEIQNEDYEVAISLKTDADSDFDVALDKLEDLEKAAQKIGENFVVANEDLRELNQQFPGIVKNLQDLGDGTSRLSQEAVELAVTTAKSEVKANNEATIEKLKGQRAELESKKNIALKVEELAKRLAKNEYENEKAKDADIEDLQQNLSQLKTKSNKKSSEAQIKNNGIVVSKLLSGFSSMGSGARKTAQSITDSFFQSAKNIISNFKEVKKATSGDESAKATSTTIKSSLSLVTETIKNSINSAVIGLQGYAEKATNTIKNMTSTSWNNIAENAREQASAYSDMINDIDGEIAELSSRGDSLAAAFDRIRSGQAGKAASKKNGGKTKDPNSIDGMESKKDVYHDIDIILKQISNDMDVLEQKEKKTSGKALIENLNKQLVTLQRQIDATGDKIGIAKQEAQRLRNELSFDGVTFNPDGTIANYADIYDKQLNYINSLTDAYNSMSAEEQEKYKDVVEAAKKDFNNLIENIKEYDKTITETIPGLEKDIQSAIDKQIEIKISEFDMEIKIGLDLADAERDWNNFKKVVIDQIKDTDILGNTKAKIADFLTYYKDGMGGIIQQNTAHVNEIVGQLKVMAATGSSPIYGDNQAQAMEDLKKYYEQLMKDLIDVEELVKDIKGSYLEMMNEASNAFSEQLDMYESLAGTINHDMKLIELVYGDTMYKQLGNYYEKMVEVNNSQLDFQKQQVELWAEQMELLEENSEEWKAAKENWLSAVKQWESSLEDAIENIKNKYTNTIDEIFQGLNNELTNGAGLSYVKNQWDLINKNSDEYLDNINATYEVQKLQDKYLKAMDNTDNLIAQRELKNIMDNEISALREKDKLTKYDLERAELKYQIALKQVNLEEALKNKSTLRLKRDSQGNYNYQYSTNQEDISNLQQEMSDLYNQLYNLDVSRYKENLNKIYDVWVNFQEEMKEAALINDPQEREERELLLKDQYSKLITGIVEQNEDIRYNLYESTFLELSDLYDTNLENFEAMIDDNTGAFETMIQTNKDGFLSMVDNERDLIMQKMIPQWNSGIQQMTNKFREYAVNTQNSNNQMMDILGNKMNWFVGICETSFNKIKVATQTYEKELNTLQSVAGVNFTKISQGIDSNITKTQNLINKNNDLVSAYKAELSEIADVIKSLDALSSKYGKARQDAINATNAAKDYWRQQQEIAQNIAHLNDSQRAVSSGDMAQQNGYNGNQDNSFFQATSSQGNGNLDLGDTATLSGKYYYDSYGTSPAGSRYAGVDHGVVVDRINNNPFGVHIHSADGKYPDLGWVKKSQLSGFDTGGYTGSWGTDGRLALLHQKELVLNADDTINFLAGIEVLRDITNTFGRDILNKMNNQNFNMGQLTQDLNQNVHIEASFPNVKDHSEIETALMNLTNKASMYIHK